jgi:hypothetical protein
MYSCFTFHDSICLIIVNIIIIIVIIIVIVIIIITFDISNRENSMVIQQVDYFVLHTDVVLIEYCEVEI